MGELEYMQDKVRGYMNDLADHMATGGCTEWDQYTYSTGMVKAFATVERDIIDLLEKMKEA